MPKQPNPKDHGTARSSPRATAALEVEVEVAGERRKVRLVSRDIGAGGIFLRTDKPAELWSKVKLVLSLPAGGTFEVGGEVVRSVPKDKAKGHPAGMAVAFDEVSRGKRKELIALVLDLCAQRPAKEEKPKEAKDAPPPPREPARKPEAPADKDSTDELLDELDDLLDSVESEIDVEVEDSPESLDTDEEREASAEIIIEDVEVIDLEEPEEKPAAKPLPKKGAPKGAAEPAAKTAASRPPSKPPSRPPSRPPSKPLPKGTAKTAPAKPAKPVASAKPAGGVDDLRAALAEYKKNLKGDTYYDILEVGMKSSAKEIESAYQKLLGRLKPPGAPDSLPADLLRELSAVLGKVRKAFAILSKPDRKRAYDFLIDNEVDDF